jgi:putative ABC transport system permease protein
MTGHLGVALASVWRERRRSLPAAAGVAVGVAALVSMVAVGRGTEAQVAAQLRSLGSDLVVVSAGQVRVIRGQARQVGNVTTLRLEDASAMAGECPSVKSVAPAQSQKLPLKWGDLSTSSTVLGTTPEYLEARSIAVGHGRFFHDDELRAALRVAVLGPTVVQNLFGERPAFGETIRLNRVPFEVVGILAARGLDRAGQDQDDVVLIPIRTALRRLFNLDHIGQVYVQAHRGRTSEAAAEVRALLRERHRLRHRPDDFTIQDQSEVLAAEKSSAQSFTLLLVIVAVVALLVGGVGVLALMLIAVRERVREIGLRRAIGATRRDILWQFIEEALLIGLAGGLGGLGVGTGAAAWASTLGSWPLLLSVWVAALAVLSATLIAVAFGAVPARRAARLDPAVALRSG